MSFADFITEWENQQIAEEISSSIIRKNVIFLGNKQFNIPKNSFSVAILGIPDLIDDHTFSCANRIRENLYKLVEISNNLKIIDLGNIRCGNNYNDTCLSISKVVNEIYRLNTKVILLGGSSKFHWGTIMAGQKSNIPVNMVSIDAEIDPEVFAPTYINDFTEHDDLSALFNFTNIGFQSYLVERETTDLINDYHFEAYRLGVVRSKIEEMEPVLRDSNLLSFSLNAVKFADAPGSVNPSPNGLTGDEACQLSFFAGHSNRITAFGLYDLKPQKEALPVTAKLGAQIIWYLLEGIANCIVEEPDITPENFTKYIIHHNQTDLNLSFYKSMLTNRWWMEIANEKTKRNVVLSCSEGDYLLACRQEIPERWWRTHLRLNF